MKRIDYRLYLVTDEPSRYSGDWLENVDAAIQGGVTCVQYRDTQSNGRILFERARALQDLLKARKIPLIINNDVGLALALAADGIHIGCHDMPVEVVHSLVGGRMEVGYSIPEKKHLADVAQCPIAVLGVGPIFDATRTKADAAPAMGVDGLKEILEETSVPSVAIGGITLENAPAIVRAGVEGLAIVSAFSRAIDPFAAAKAFRALF